MLVQWNIGLPLNIIIIIGLWLACSYNIIIMSEVCDKMVHCLQFHIL